MFRKADVDFYNVVLETMYNIKETIIHWPLPVLRFFWCIDGDGDVGGGTVL